jgi:hypothetical protein
MHHNRTEECPLKRKTDLKKEEQINIMISAALASWNDSSFGSAAADYTDIAAASTSKWRNGKQCSVLFPQPKAFLS